MLEQIILGIVQGIFEWLPVSSEGILILVKENFLGGGDLEALIREALFLHLGTFLAVLAYFHKDVFFLLKSFLNYEQAEKEYKRILDFLVISTLISGILGFALLKILSGLEEKISFGGRVLTAGVGCLLLATAYLQIKAPAGGHKKAVQVRNKDSVLLGFLQGLAVLPGLSRSGLTVSGLLLRQFDDSTALRLSFLMSLPMVLAGNVILNLRYLVFSMESLVGLVFSFVFGLLTIGLLLKAAKKLNFGWFVLVFALLVILSVFV